MSSKLLRLHEPIQGFTIDADVVLNQLPDEMPLRVDYKEVGKVINIKIEDGYITGDLQITDKKFLRQYLRSRHDVQKQGTPA